MAFGSKPAKALTKLAEIEVLCAQLDAARAASRAHRQKFKSVYERGGEIDAGAADLEAKIKAKLAAEYLGKPSGIKTVFEGTSVLVTVTPQNSRTIDEARFMKEQRAVLEEIGAIVKVPAQKAHDELDMKVVDSAVHKKLIEKSVVDQYITAGDPRTPAVSFKQPTPKES